MNNADDRFPDLWNAFRKQVQDARTSRPIIETRQELPKLDKLMFAGSIQFGSPDADGTNLYFHHHAWSGSVSMSTDDLIALSAQCMSVAMEIEEKKKRVAA